MDEIYNRITRVGDPEAEIAALEDADVRALHDYLESSSVQTGIPLLVRCLLSLEGEKRFFEP
jgi:hypothetical protein